MKSKIIALVALLIIVLPLLAFSYPHRDGPTYREVDNSASTLSSLYYHRRGIPCGVLVHTTASTNSLDWLQRGSAINGSPASADVLIDRDGTRHRIVPRGFGSYHAGISVLDLGTCTANGSQPYRGDGVSNALLGIELEDTATQVPTYAQIDSLAGYIVQEGLTYNWRWPYNVFGHYSVARPAGRRSDPSNFAWGSLMGRLYYLADMAQVGGLH